MDSSITPIKFDIYQGGQLVRTEILTEPTIKIGKLTSSHVRIDDDSVSRMHAVVEVGPSGVVILDLGSATGTFVNGEKVTKQSLSTGDRVQLGNVMVQVTIAGQLSAQASARAAQAPVQTGPLFDEEEDLGAGRSLEVLALWGPTVIDVRHLGDEEQYLIGDDPAANQFVNPKSIPQDPYPLAISDGASMVVNVPDGVEGDVMLDGKVYGLEELKAAGKLGREQPRAAVAGPGAVPPEDRRDDLPGQLGGRDAASGAGVLLGSPRSATAALPALGGHPARALLRHRDEHPRGR